MKNLSRNPYVAGNPVGGSPAFAGREDVIREVRRILKRPQESAVVLYGQRRIGKTSVLQELGQRLRGDGWRPVYFDLQDKAAWPLDQVVVELARAVARALDVPEPDLGPTPAGSFHTCWLPEVLKALPDSDGIVLLFDEFDVLADAGAHQAGQAFFPYLRPLLTMDPTHLGFAFVIGRNVGDLAQIALSLFKGIPALPVSLLSREDAAWLVRLSERNGTLKWPDAAVDQVWSLTCGHPFLTQMLCSHVWEAAWEDEPEEVPVISAATVDSLVPRVLDASRNVLEWLWSGLQPAQRVVAAALAMAGQKAITAEELEEILRNSGVRVLIRELQDAPRLLQDWDLLEEVPPGAQETARGGEGGWRFRVEILRRWITEHKPLRRVQEDLDRVIPLAETYYQAARTHYEGGEAEQALDPLKKALRLNPNHVRASELYADLLLARGEVTEARQVLEHLVEIQPATARPRLVQVLLSQASNEEEDQALALYEKVLGLDPLNREAQAGRQSVWQKRAEAARQAGDLPKAQAAFRESGLIGKAAEVEALLKAREMNEALARVRTLEGREAWGEALAEMRRIAEEYRGDRDWSGEILRLERLARLEDLYIRALGALRTSDVTTARQLLLEILREEAVYKDVPTLYYTAVSGDDPVQTRVESRQAVAESRIEADRQARRAGNWRVLMAWTATAFVVTLAAGAWMSRSWSLWRLQRFCDGGSAPSCVDLASRYADDLPDVDGRRRLALLSRACELEVQYCGELSLLTNSHKATNSTVLANPTLAALACQGDNGPACLAAARTYKNGVAPDLARALPLFERACTEDQVEGCREAGLAWRNGRGTEPSTAKARPLLQKACDGGDGPACTALGEILADEQDAGGAYARFDMACKTGDALGCYRLGTALENGMGVPADPLMAAEAYHRACDLDRSLGCERVEQQPMVPEAHTFQAPTRPPGAATAPWSTPEVRPPADALKPRYSPQVDSPKKAVK